MQSIISVNNNKPYKPMETKRIAYSKNPNGSFTFYFWSVNGTLIEKQTYIGYPFYQAKQSFTNLINKNSAK